LLFSAGSPLSRRELGVDVPHTFKQLNVGPILHTPPQSPGSLSAGAVLEMPANAKESTNPYVHSVTSISSRTSGMCSSMEPGSSILFQLTGGKGAILLTKHSIYREDVQRERNFKEYAKVHYDSWVVFAREHGHSSSIKPVLVTGVDMTRNFAMLSCSNKGKHWAVGFRISAPGDAPPWGIWVKARGGVDTNCGPQLHRPPGNAHTAAVSDEYNQCVFVRYYTMLKRLGIPRVIKAAAGPHDLGPGV